MMIWIAVVSGALIIAGLSYYAGSLLYRLKKQNQRVQQAITDKNDRAIESINVIAKAMLQEQCDVSEGALRICVLLDHIQIDNRPDFTAVYPACHSLYEKIKHMPTHDARMAQDKKERRRMDMQRWKYEAEYKDAILQEADVLAGFAV